MDQDAIMALTEQLVAAIFSMVGFQPSSILSIPPAVFHRMHHFCWQDGINALLVSSCNGLHAALHMPVPSCSPSGLPAGCQGAVSSCCTVLTEGSGNCR